jgi:hypothetical protein
VLFLLLDQADATYEIRQNGLMVVPLKGTRGVSARLPPSSAALHAKLRLPTMREINFDPNTPLKEALSYVSEVYGIQIVIDNKAFRKAGIEEAQEQPIKLPKTPPSCSVALILKVLLRQLGATYSVHDEFILIVPGTPLMAHVAPRTLEPGELETLWKELAGEAFPDAFQALGTMAADPKRSVEFLKDHLKPVSPVDAGKIEKLLADLDNDEFAIRNLASQSLEQLGESAEPHLRKALEGKPTLEVRRRVDDLLRKLNHEPPSPELARDLRALALLEHLGTPGACQVLGRMAQGAPGVRQTREAAEALERLAKRKTEE